MSARAKALHEWAAILDLDSRYYVGLSGDGEHGRVAHNLFGQVAIQAFFGCHFVAQPPICSRPL